MNASGVVPLVTAAGVTPAARAAPARVVSIDVFRGIIMVLMVLDHVRVFISGATAEPTDLSQTTVALFLTRWVTHFCAPGFVFLAGVSAFLHGQRLGGRRRLAGFLLSRGVWLILLELSVIRLSWTFNLRWDQVLLAGVIWCIGWCLIALAGLMFLPRVAAGALALAVIGGHNLLDGLIPGWLSTIRGSSCGWLAQVLYLGGAIRVGAAGPYLIVLYSLVPWVGVMLAGYVFGAIFTGAPHRRDRLCWLIGGSAILLFVILRSGNFYGDVRSWTAQPSAVMSVLSFVNTRKYPASLLFLLMTLGPLIALLPSLAGGGGRLGRVLAVFGRTPLLFYLLHIPLIHLVAVILAIARFGQAIPWLFANHPVAAPPPPEGYGYGLPMVYAVTAIVAALLYWPCRWLGDLRRRNRSSWLSYL